MVQGEMRTDRQAFIEENLGLVHLLVRRYLGRGVEYDDLFQAGCLGLCKACDGFDPGLGHAFSTYAVPVILGEIRRLFREAGSLKISRSIKENAALLQKVRTKFEEEEGRSPTVRELALASNLSHEAVSEALLASGRPLSLSAPDDQSGKLPDIPCESREGEVTERLSLEKELEKLEEADKNLLRLRYFGGLTQEATAARLSMTQVQVSRREKKLLLLLRHALAE